MLENIIVDEAQFGVLVLESVIVNVATAFKVAADHVTEPAEVFMVPVP